MANVPRPTYSEEDEDDNTPPPTPPDKNKVSETSNNSSINARNNSRKSTKRTSSRKSSARTFTVEDFIPSRHPDTVKKQQAIYEPEYISNAMEWAAKKQQKKISAVFEEAHRMYMNTKYPGVLDEYFDDECVRNNWPIEEEEEK
jgi:hypothetical protein